MSDDETPKDPAGGTVLVFRNPDGTPVAVPEDVVNAAERAYRCHTRRIKGDSWDLIAAEEGYESVGAGRSTTWPATWRTAARWWWRTASGT